MKNNTKLKTVRIKNTADEDRIGTLDEVIDLISTTTGVQTDYTGAVNWLIKQFEEDRITQ